MKEIWEATKLRPIIFFFFRKEKEKKKVKLFVAVFVIFRSMAPQRSKDGTSNLVCLLPSLYFLVTRLRIILQQLLFYSFVFWFTL